MKTAVRRAINHATSAWSVVFGLPHLWWALGIRFGFPGGSTSYDHFMGSRWRYAYDVVVVAMSVAGALVPQALLKPGSRGLSRLVLLTMVWTAFVMLTVRGVAGLVVNGMDDLIWNPLFTLGGALFGAVAWTAQRHPA